MMKIIAILHSPSAGNNNISRDDIRDAFEKHDKKLVMLDMDDGVERVTKEMRRNKAELIVAAGGDGTVNMAASIAMRAKVPLAVLPLGTLNHFAKDVGLPLDFNEAIETILVEHFETLDYCTVNDHVFVNNSSIGMYPISVKERSKLEPKLGKWLATAITFIGAVRRLRTMRLRLEMGQKNYSYKTPLLFVGNNSYKFEKTGFLNRTHLTGGKLFVYVIRANRITTFIRLIVDAFFGRRQKSKDFMINTKNKLVVHSRTLSLEVAIDGEVKTLPTPLEYSMHRRGLLVCRRSQ